MGERIQSQETMVAKDLILNIKNSSPNQTIEERKAKTFVNPFLPS
jgi:hypothetical protein